MEHIHHLINTFTWLIPLVIICIIWDSTWKLIGMWKAGRNNDLVWFICIAFFSTMGILPLIYILLSKGNVEKDTTV
jgi:uncharacterized membrane protein